MQKNELKMPSHDGGQTNNEWNISVMATLDNVTNEETYISKQISNS